VLTKIVNWNQILIVGNSVYNQFAQTGGSVAQISKLPIINTTNQADSFVDVSYLNSQLGATASPASFSLTSNALPSPAVNGY
jgi:hypothetical protein